MTASASGLDVVQLAHDYLRESKLLQLGTFSAAGDDAFAHVWFATDRNLSLYFVSNKGRKHSEQIRAESRVVFGVVGIPLEGLGQVVRGITGRGSAVEVSATELKLAYDVYVGRWPKAEQLFPLSAMQSGESPMRVYKLVPSQLILFDEENFPQSPRQVVI